ncbi:hypothetical protein UO65_6016 [Actinokineospora spheciospongiae]|uniref:Uncharacterized protein n=1 Tax=Actinokineospora spheciospongiae TaxID=909613 RepID=W7IPL0_9PSEU|nr:hypothetical protein UO65_6016 [Actinokineospora spheciospongiae]
MRIEVVRPGGTHDRSLPEARTPVRGRARLSLRIAPPGAWRRPSGTCMESPSASVAVVESGNCERCERLVHPK